MLLTISNHDYFSPWTQQDDLTIKVAFLIASRNSSKYNKMTGMTPYEFEQTIQDQDRSCGKNVIKIQKIEATKITRKGAINRKVQYQPDGHKQK